MRPPLIPRIRRTAIEFAITFFAALFLFAWVSCIQAAHADVRFSWDPNPAEEQVTSYDLQVDAAASVNVTGTDALCSELSPPMDCQDGQTHTVRVRAINAVGHSDWSVLPFGPSDFPPTSPAGLSVRETDP